MRQPVEHRRHRDPADFARGLVHRGERHRQQAGERQVVDAHDPDLLRDAVAQVQQRAHQAARGPVVGADEGLGLLALDEGLHHLALRRVEFLHEVGIARHALKIKRLAITGDARLDRRSRVGQREKSDPLAAELEQVRRRQVSHPPVIDADKIVIAALRVGEIAAVEQHDRDARLVELGGDLPVDRAVLVGKFQWRKKDAGHAPLDILTAKFQRLLAAQGALGRMAPQERVLPLLRRGRHPLADRLEDFRPAEIGNEQAESQPRRLPLAGVSA